MRNPHSAELERTAANLIANPQVQGFHDLKNVSNEQLRVMAIAVAHDCRDCEAARIQEAARVLEEKRKSKENADRTAREAKAKEVEAEKNRRALADKKKRAGGSRKTPSGAHSAAGQPRQRRLSSKP
jgi:hypothetical protein